MELHDYLKLPYTIALKPDSAGDWIAEIEELEGCVAHGDTQQEALDHIDEAKRLWIEETLASGQPVPQPNTTEILPSGKWLQRVPRSLHKNLARLAKLEGSSLNQLVTSILSDYVGGARRQPIWSITSRVAWPTVVQIRSARIVTSASSLEKGTFSPSELGVGNVLEHDVPEKVG